MRQIFPVDPAAEILGPAEPLRLAWSKPPAADSDDPGASGLIARLAEIYAFPDQPGPWVKANMITSVDGAISVQGRSGGLSGLADKVIFGLLRSLADVVVAGAQTARAERYGPAKPAAIWPQLRKGRPVTPPIAIVTKRLTLDLDSPLIKGNGGPRTILLTTSQAPADRVDQARATADVIIAGEDEVPATAIVGKLAELGHRRILVEGGPTLLARAVGSRFARRTLLVGKPADRGRWCGQDDGVEVRGAAGAPRFRAPGPPGRRRLPASQLRPPLAGNPPASQLESPAPGALPQPLEGLGQDRRAVARRPALLHVRQVRLVRLRLRWRRRAGRVTSGRNTAARAIPGVRDRGVVGEARHRFVAVAAEERHPNPRRRLASLCFAHRAGANPAPANGVTTTHYRPLSEINVRAKAAASRCRPLAPLPRWPLAPLPACLPTAAV